MLLHPPKHPLDFLITDGSLLRPGTAREASPNTPSLRTQPMQRFLAYLPDAEDGDGGEALMLIADDLQWLLVADVGELWSVARADPSLLLLIATYLQYAK